MKIDWKDIITVGIYTIFKIVYVKLTGKNKLEIDVDKDGQPDITINTK